MARTRLTREQVQEALSQVLTVQAAADLHGIDTKTLYNWLDAKRLTKLTAPSGEALIWSPDLDDFLMQQGYFSPAFGPSGHDEPEFVTENGGDPPKRKRGRPLGSGRVKK